MVECECTISNIIVNIEDVLIDTWWNVNTGDAELKRIQIKF